MSKMKQLVWLVGIGMGASETFSVEAVEAVRESDCVIGARRMLESVNAGARQTPETGNTETRYWPGSGGIGEKPVYSAYKPEEICRFIITHPEYRKIAVLYSGDIGFYSGAKELCRLLKDTCEVRGIPGISSVIYLAARLKVTWEDARLVSIHGRRQPYIHILARHRKCFLLFGGNGQEEEFCRQLREYRLDRLKIWIGKYLSYDEENILYRTGADIRPEDLSGLTALYVENPSPFSLCNGQIRDDAFIRGNVPMTKEEVRAVSIAKLELSDDSVLYDVGAGTGSIAVTAAALYETVRVYAVEKKAEGAELIRQNQKKFCVDQLYVTEGTAPDALRDLEPPTHVFIGGSSGNLEEILCCVRKKNPNVRIVLNAVTLETLTEVLEAEKKGLLGQTEIVQVSAARARRIADYHMMMGQNPIYIVSANAVSDV